MRRPVFVAVLSTLLMVACSEQSTEPNPPESTPSISPDVIGVGACPATPPTAAQLLTQINQLLPNSPIRATVIALVNALPSRFQDRLKTIVRTQIFLIQDFVLKSFYAGKLNGGKSASTFDNVLQLIRSLYCYVGLTPPNFPSTTNGQDVAVGVVFPNSPKTTIATPSAHAAVTVPQGAAPAATTIVVRSLPDSPGPLLTSLNQYPLFFEFSGTTATGAVVFNQNVTVGVCPVGAASGTLRLAHNVAPLNFGDVEILPLQTTVPGVSCQNVSFLTESDHSLFATGSTRWRAVGRALEPFAQALLPEPLHASSIAVTTAVGGTTKKFSPFGVVDVASNPGILRIVDQSGNPTSGNVSGPGNVYVKVTSQNLTPINSVPVNFGGTTRFTGANGNGTGIASFNWSDASPGASLTATVPNETVGEGNSCPIFGSDAAIYRPRVCFTPSSVTFSEPLQLPGFGSSGIHYNLGDIDGFEAPEFDEVEWTTNGIAPFGTLINHCFTAGTVKTEWTGSILLIRSSFDLGAVPEGGLNVRIAIDNDVQLFVNGNDVTSSSFVTHFPPEPNYLGFDEQFQQHGNCPTYGTGGSNFLFHVPASDLVSGTNLLAIRARDAGDVSFLDFEVTLAP